MNRRDFISAAGSQMLAMSTLAGHGMAQTQQSSLPGIFDVSRPNLLYILVDQLSGLALPHFDSNARMPNCQKLAKSGVVFTHAYTAGMTCGPSRASLDTGLHTQTHGVGGGFTLSPAVESLQRSLAGHGYANSHPNGEVLEAERAEHEKWLIDLGYERPLSSINGVESLARYADLPLKWKCGRAGVAPEHGFEAFCAQRAMRFIEMNQKRPFACFLQLRGPHDPYMVPRPYDTIVDPMTLAVPPYRTGEFENKPLRQRQSFETQGASRMTDMQIRQALSLYYGMSSYSDYAIGLVLDRLRELRLDDNTIVILVSDHGDTMGRHRFMSKDFAFYEPAMRIPMILRCPNRKGGIMNSDPVSGIDVFPTLCDLMGFQKPSHIPGQSLVGRWEGKESDPERVIFSAQGRPGKDRAVMLRTPRYKYTRYDDGGTELYDLERDPDELENRVNSADYAQPLARLKQQLDEWERRYPHRA
jgi:arylsulfatase A-like enzyme